MRLLNLITLAFSFFVISHVHSQVYNMSTRNDTTCSGTFYDSGGLGLYANSSNFTQTFCTNTAGSLVKVSFTSFQTEAGTDILCIYDGPTTGSPLIGCYSGANTLNGISFLSTSGCLTFNFTSDGSTNLNGWAATLSCEYACQPVNARVDSVNPMPDASPLKIIRGCRGSTINFMGNATYPLSGTNYNQSNATSSFVWNSGDGFRINGQNVSHTYNTNGVFDVNLVVTDTLGRCHDTAYAARVIISDIPNFAGANFYPNDTICLGDTATIMIPALFVPFQPPTLNAAGTTFLPDGTGVSYRDTINVNIFDPAATHQTGFLQSVYLNMEHSYLGDLQISLSCPNGTTAVLKQYPGGGGTHLGEPVDPFTTPVPLNPGVGYTYEFTDNKPRYGTMINEAGVYQHNYTDVLANTYTNQDYLPAGTYTPFQNLSTRFNGCPLNGNWIVTVTDNLAIDNGYIFHWGLKFDSLIRPPSASAPITPFIDTAYWTVSPSILAQPNDSTIVVSPTTSGTHQFTYHIQDNVGCSHDTTVDLYVKPKPKSNAGMDFTTCRLDYQLSPVPTPGATATTWYYYTPSLTGTSTLSNSAISTPNTIVNEYSNFFYVIEETVDGCQTYPDTVEITHIQLVNTIDISVDKDTVCIPEAATFTNNSDMTYFDSIYWNFGDGTTSNTQGSASHTYSTAGCFDLTVTLVNTLGCRVDSVLPNIVCAYPTPVASFNYSPYEPIVPETYINFANTSTGGTSYVWDFAGLGTSTNKDDGFEFPKTEGGQYPVTLTVTNEGGCTDQVTNIITIKNPLSIWIPNSFTPNEDGLNDVFRVVFNNASVTDYSIMIFNRWGELMFYSEDTAFEWDGTLNGQKVPVGTYTWKMTGKEEFATDGFTKIGHITLVR